MVATHLTFSCDNDVIGNLSGGGCLGVVFENRVYVFSRNLEDNIDTIQEWSRDFGLIAADLVVGTCAGFVAITIESTGTGIHCAYEHKIGRILHGADGTRDSDSFVFDGLAKYFKYLTREFGKLIEK